MKNLLVATTGMLLLMLEIITLPSKSAQAVQIGLQNFGSNAILESFEGLSSSENKPLLENESGVLKLGVDGQPIVFGSGVVLTGPLPSELPPSAIGIQLDDWSIGRASFGLGENGQITSVADVPDGTAYLALDVISGPIEFTFPFDVFRVGALVTGASFTPGGSATPINLSAFDSKGNLLETVTIGSVKVSDWRNNFLGLESATGIRKVTFSGGRVNGESYLVLDRLTFETQSIPPASIPEPSLTLGLLIVFSVNLLKNKNVLSNNLVLKVLNSSTNLNGSSVPVMLNTSANKFETLIGQ
jgi:hypothetical protein